MNNRQRRLPQRSGPPIGLLCESLFGLVINTSTVESPFTMAAVSPEEVEEICDLATLPMLICCGAIITCCCCKCPVVPTTAAGTKKGAGLSWFMKFVKPLLSFSALLFVLGYATAAFEPTESCWSGCWGVCSSEGDRTEVVCVVSNTCCLASTDCSLVDSAKQVGFRKSCCKTRKFNVRTQVLDIYKMN